MQHITKSEQILVIEIRSTGENHGEKAVKGEKDFNFGYFGSKVHLNTQWEILKKQ
jgi:hypothetical protein